MEKNISNLIEMGQFADEVLQGLMHNPEIETATTLGLSGDLGSGKTTFVKAIASALGIRDTISSPTFVLAKYYDIPRPNRFSRLVHIDAYRIESTEELRALNWDVMLREPRNLVVIEWPERLAEKFPVHAQVIKFRFIDEATRAVVFSV